MNNEFSMKIKSIRQIIYNVVMKNTAPKSIERIGVKSDTTITFSESDYLDESKRFFTTIPIYGWEPIEYDKVENKGNTPPRYDEPSISDNYCKIYKSTYLKTSDISSDLLSKGTLFQRLLTWKINPTTLKNESFIYEDVIKNCRSNGLEIAPVGQNLVVDVIIELDGGYLSTCQLNKTDVEPYYSISTHLGGNVQHNIITSAQNHMFNDRSATYQLDVMNETFDACKYSGLQEFAIYDNDFNTGGSFFINSFGPHYALAAMGGESISGDFFSPSINYDVDNALAEPAFALEKKTPFAYGTYIRASLPFCIKGNDTSKEKILNLVQKDSSFGYDKRKFFTLDYVQRFKQTNNGIVGLYLYWTDYSNAIVEDNKEKYKELAKFDFDEYMNLACYKYTNGYKPSRSSESQNVSYYMDCQELYEKYPGYGSGDIITNYSLHTNTNKKTALYNFFNETQFVKTNSTALNKDKDNTADVKNDNNDGSNSSGGSGGSGNNGIGPGETSIGGNGNYNYQGDYIGSAATPSIDMIDGGFTTVYVLDKSQLNAVARYLWSKGFIDNVHKLLTDPMDYVISLQMTMAPISNTTSASIYVGGLDSGVEGRRLNTQYVQETFPNIVVPSTFGANDFSQYLGKAIIHVPFVGWQTLDINDVIGSTITPVLTYDVVSGLVNIELRIKKTIVSNGNTNVVDTVKYSYIGNVNQQIPINGKNYAEMFRTISSSVLQGAGAIAMLAI